MTVETSKPPRWKPNNSFGSRAAIPSSTVKVPKSVVSDNDVIVVRIELLSANKPSAAADVSELVSALVDKILCIRCKVALMWIDNIVILFWKRYRSEKNINEQGFGGGGG